MNIPQGYKQTELGIIPEDWELISIKERGCLVKDGINPMLSPNVSFWEYSMPAFDNDKQPTLSLGEEMHSNRTIIRDTVLLFNKLNVRQQRVWFVERPSGNSVCSMEFLPYVSKSINLGFLYHYLKTDVVTDYFNGISKGTSNSQKRITPQDFLDYKVMLPPIAEQRAIAEALSDVDGLIAVLDKKIAKKRLLKHGAMQQLLTGKKRLPGFTDEWVEKKVKDVFRVTRGYVLATNKVVERPDGYYKYPVFSSQTQNNGVMGYYSDYLFEDAITWTTDGANAGEVNYRQGKFYCTNVCGVLISEEGYANECVASIINMVAKSHVSYIGNPKLMNNVMADIEICIPPSIKEQRAIATILSDMDKEIADLEAQRNKYRLLKSGMMQKLLTGQIRLK